MDMYDVLCIQIMARGLTTEAIWLWGNSQLQSAFR